MNKYIITLITAMVIGSNWLFAQQDSSTIRCLIYPNKTLLKIDGVLQPPKKTLINTTHGFHKIQLWSEGHYLKDTTIFLNAKDTLTFLVLMTETPQYKEHLTVYRKLENKRNTYRVTPILLMGGSAIFTTATYLSTKKTYNEMVNKKNEYINENVVPLVHRKSEEHAAIKEKFLKRRNLYRTSLGVLAVSSVSSYFMIRAARKIKLPVFQDDNAIHWQPVGLHPQYDGRLGLQTTLTLNIK